MKVRGAKQRSNSLGEGLVKSGGLHESLDDCSSFSFPAVDSMRIKLLGACFIVLALVPGCSDSGVDRTAFTERDSAGVRIAENARPTWESGQQWSIDSTLVSVGAAEERPGQQLHRITGAVRLSDGRLVIANGGSFQLLRYDSTGAYLGATGRAGDGPGEFRALSWVGRLPGDSVLTWDRGLNRVTVFTSDGEYARDYTPSLPEEMTGYQLQGALDDNRLLLTRGASFQSAQGTAGVQRQPIVGWIIDSSGKQVGSIGPFPGESVFLGPGKDPGSTIRTAIPLGASTLFATASDAVHVVDTDFFAVRTYGIDGRLRMIARRPHAPQVVRPEDITAVVEAALEDLPPVQWIRDGMKAAYAEVPPPQYLPAIRAVRVDRDDNVWVQAGHAPTAADATWSVFERRGRWLGDVILPAALEILEIGRDHVVVRDRDPDGVERVRILRLRK